MTETNDMRAVEDIFLDISIHQVYNPIAGTYVEPWKSMYVDSIRERRYGDAIWARVCIEGEVEDGIIRSIGPNNDMTVLDDIKDTALEAKSGDPEWYREAIQFYKNTSSKDGHPEIIELIFEVDRMDVPQREDETEDEDGEEEDLEFDCKL
ncbi:hypothetical protein F53441_6798 [Fusarium austroafricanum]|uniref:Uncharacterized protein n=1 Tax=Fusarium austroafricanum TaxID=2364996 RepID=A0A8H4NSX9_9HYPO|nr:hypothetical protein F53441_6798 [Fusarium austroafricanum]